MTAVAVTVAGVRGGGGIVITTLIAAGMFFFGLALWWFGGTEKKPDEIGRVVMIGVVLAAIAGVAQYQIGQQQTQRNFQLSLALQRDLTGADLARRDLTQVRLRGKSLAGANLRGAILNGVDLASTNLRFADLTGAELRNADLRRAKLDGAILAEADLRSATLKDATLINANLRRADLRRTNLELTKLSSSCLAGAKMQEALLAGADLGRAVLTGANVRRTVFESDLRPARLDQAGLASAGYDDETEWPIGFDYKAAVAGEARISATARPRAPVAELIPARVIEVVAGDNVKMQADPGFDDRLPAPGRTAFIGVDTPEDTDQLSVDVQEEPGGAEARRFVEEELLNRRVTVQIGRSSATDPDRIPVYVWTTTSRTFNEEILERGLGKLRVRGDTQLLMPLRNAELSARQRGVGLWKECLPPRRYAPPPLFK